MYTPSVYAHRRQMSDEVTVSHVTPGSLARRYLVCKAHCSGSEIRAEDTSSGAATSDSQRLAHGLLDLPLH